MTPYKTLIRTPMIKDIVIRRNELLIVDASNV